MKICADGKCEHGFECCCADCTYEYRLGCICDDVESGADGICEFAEEVEQMELINGYWTDERNNQWDSKTYSAVEALDYSKSLIDCQDCLDCQDCQDCQNCWNCQNCQNCQDCWNCKKCANLQCAKNYTIQPAMYSTPRIGSREDITYMYHGHTADGVSMQVVCGRFRGNLNEFARAVDATHGSNEHGVAYRSEIAKARVLFGLEGDHCGKLK